MLKEHTEGRSRQSQGRICLCYCTLGLRAGAWYAAPPLDGLCFTFLLRVRAVQFEWVCEGYCMHNAYLSLAQFDPNPNL